MRGLQAQRSERLRRGVWRERNLRRARAKTELTYTTTGGTSRAKPALGTLIVCIIQVVQAARPGKEPGHPTTDGDAMRDRNGNRGPASTRAARTDAPGSARGSGAQRRYVDARAFTGPGCGHFPGTDRSIHQRARMDLPGAADRVVFHWVQARRREPGRGAEAAAHRLAASDSDVRCAIEKCAEVVCHTTGQLFDPRSQKLCGSDAEFSGGVPVRTGNSRRSLRLRRSGADAGPVPRAEIGRAHV